MNLPIRGFAALCMGALLAIPALADDQDVIDYRQHIMKTLQDQSAALGQIMSQAAPDDNLDKHLQIIALTAATSLKAFEQKVPSEGIKDAVWSNWADFSKRMNEFAEGTAKAAQAGKADKNIGATQMAEVLSSTCKGCHQQYRIEKKK